MIQDQGRWFHGWRLKALGTGRTLRVPRRPLYTPPSVSITEKRVQLRHHTFIEHFNFGVGALLNLVFILVFFLFRIVKVYFSRSWSVQISLGERVLKFLHFYFQLRIQYISLLALKHDFWVKFLVETLIFLPRFLVAFQLCAWITWFLKLLSPAFVKRHSGRFFLAESRSDRIWVLHMQLFFKVMIDATLIWTFLFDTNAFWTASTTFSPRDSLRVRLLQVTVQVLIIIDIVVPKVLIQELSAL